MGRVGIRGAHLSILCPAYAVAGPIVPTGGQSPTSSPDDFRRRGTRAARLLQARPGPHPAGLDGRGGTSAELGRTRARSPRGADGWLRRRLGGLLSTCDLVTPPRLAAHRVSTRPTSGASATCPQVGTTATTSTTPAPRNSRHVTRTASYDQGVAQAVPRSG
jgi:hypothetical protein